MKNLIHIISTVAVIILFNACSGVNSNPSGGARECCNELLDYAKSNNYEEAAARMNKYISSYSEQDQNSFFMVMSILLKDNQEYKPIINFFRGADFEQYPIFKEYIVKILAWDMALQESLQNDTSPNAGLSEVE